MIKKGLIALFSIAIIFIIYLFIWGILFPWSPIKFGFNNIDFNNASVLYPKNILLPNEYRSLDRLMTETEKFHKLKYRGMHLTPPKDRV